MDFKSLIRFIDFTSLSDSDTEESIAAFCKNSAVQKELVAAVCVYPKFIKQVIKSVPSTVKIATVVNFPQGNSSLELVLLEISQSIADGAHEIDVVFPYRAYLQGDHKNSREFIAACKKACGPKILKVILETGAFPNVGLIMTAAKDAIAAGADFVKTSTGKFEVGATLEATQAILEAIKASNKPVGLKVSGGIREPEQALAYFNQAQTILGTDWPTPLTFRIGASQLLDKLMS